MRHGLCHGLHSFAGMGRAIVDSIAAVFDSAAVFDKGGSVTRVSSSSFSRALLTAGTGLTSPPACSHRRRIEFRSASRWHQNWL